MLSLQKIPAFAVVLVLALGFTVTVNAQAPALTEALALSAHGGVSATVPAWKKVRGDASVAIYEKSPDVRRDPTFYVLMVAIEEGPTGEAVAWNQIQDNIEGASSKDGRKLDLALNEPYEGNGTFESRLMRGTFANADGKKVDIGLVALVKGGKMVTVSVMTKSLDEAAIAVLSAIADSVVLTK